MSLLKNRIVDFLIYGVLLLFLITLIVPLKPYILEPTELDPSWACTINYALLHNFRFGEDIVFTYGPLGVFLMPYYYEASTYHLSALLSLILTAVFFVSLYFVTRKTDNLSKVLSLFIIGVGFVIGEAFIWYALPILLIMLSLGERKGKSVFILSLAIVFFLSFSVLIKFSHFPTALLSILIADGYKLYKYKQKFPLFTSLFFLGMVGIFVFIGQQIGDFWSYFIGSFNTLSGYSEAMQSSGKEWMIWLFLSLFAVTNSVIATTVIKLKKIEHYLFYFVSLLVIFMAFKNGFVRHDMHALSAFGGLTFVLGLQLLYFAEALRSEPKKYLFLSISLIVTVLASSVAIREYTGHATFSAAVTKYLRDTKQKILHLPKLFSQERITELNTKYDLSIKEIRNKAPLGDINGTVDVYPWDQAMVIVNGMEFRPRPLFQSYSVYTPYLIEKNRDFLYTQKGPENILFSIKDIDGRLLPMMEGATWLDIMSLYDVVEQRGEFLHLKKSTKDKTYTLKNISSKIVGFNEIVPVPNQDVYAHIEIKKTILGEIVNTLFKSPILYIELTFKNGETKKGSIVPKIGTSGFILSPYIDNTFDFFTYAAGKTAGQKVKSFKVINDSQCCYKDTIKIDFKEIQRVEFESPKMPKSVVSHYYYGKIIEQNPQNNQLFFHLEQYNNETILFSHIGTFFTLNKKDIEVVNKRGYMNFEFGIKSEAYTNNRSGGGCFKIYKNLPQHQKIVFTQCIDPAHIVADRGDIKGKFEPENDANSYTFETTPNEGKDASNGWSYWKF